MLGGAQISWEGALLGDILGLSGLASSRHMQCNQYQSFAVQHHVSTWSTVGHFRRSLMSYWIV